MLNTGWEKEMLTDSYMFWLDAARRADAIREKVEQLSRSGAEVPPKLLRDLALLEDEVLGRRLEMSAAVPHGPLH